MMGANMTVYLRRRILTGFREVTAWRAIELRASQWRSEGIPPS